jgi:hypothetical protein
VSTHPSAIDLEIYTNAMLQGIPITCPPSSSTRPSLVTTITSHPSNVWSSTRDIKFGVDVSPLFYSIVLLNDITTSLSTLICGWERCLLDFLALDPNFYLFNLSLSNPIANSTSLNICLCIVEHPFYLTSTMASSSDVLVAMHLLCFASKLTRGCNPTSVLSRHTCPMYSTTIGCPSCFSLIYA